MKLKQYPKYKDSGIQWIGEIPEEWELERFKIRFKYQKGRIPENLDEVNGEGYLPYLSMDYLRGNSEEAYYSNDPKALKVNDGDLLLLWDGSNAGEFVKSKKGYLSSTMVKLNIDKMNNQYSWFLCSAFEPMLKDLTIGMGIPHVNGDTLGNIRIPIIEETDQQKISSFLDSKTSQSNQTISKDKQLINLLKEKRTALINHVVTKGLNPKAKMKDSGIDWIGEIPGGWEVRKVRHCFNLIGSGTTPSSSDDSYYALDEEQGIPWVITGDLNDSVLENSSKKITKKAVVDYSALKKYSKGSLVIAMYGATIGKTAMVNFEATYNQACCVLNNSNNLLIKYAHYWFIAKKQDIISLSYGGGQPNISQDVIKTLKITVPPKPEQTQIIQYLDKATSKIDQTIKKIEEKITLMEEYKKSLIHHVVTGKVDVRGIAA